MNSEPRLDLRADPARAPGDRNIEAPGQRRSIWPSIAVTAAAAAFGGVIWYAYQNGRDASPAGGPPLVKADPGPAKVKPDNPGGREIPFQDSTVYDRLGATGQKPAMEKLLPAPEAPVDRPAAAPPPSADPTDAAPRTQAPPARIGAASPDDRSPIALAPSPGAMIATQPAAKPSPGSAKAAPSAPQVASTDPIAALIDSQSPPAARIPAGAYRIRLSAVRSQGSVAPEWARLKRRYPELATLKNSFSKIDEPGKGVFYRVEAGPLDAAGAKSTCDRLRAEGLGCIVVKP